MARFVALLRGVNVGGKKLMSMKALKALVEELSFRSVRTVLQSGNLVFDASDREASELENVLEEETQEVFGIRPVYFVRTSEDWQEVCEGNPFPTEAQDDPSHLVAMLTKTPFEAEALDSLRSSYVGPEIFIGRGRTIYAYYPAGIGDSKLTNALFERKLGRPCTARNWNTVLKLKGLL